MWLYLRYFMRELVPLGVVVKPQLPLFLTSWVDKTSTSCMYTMTLTRSWSVPHLKEGCWYIECGKTICPVEEEDVKAACDKADLRGVKLRSDVVIVLEELSVADLALLPEKERNKILNQKTRNAKKAERESTRATAKAVKEATAGAEKGTKKGEKPGKSSSTFVDRDFSCNAITESPQSGFLPCIALNVKTTATRITVPHGLCRREVACSGVLLLWIPTVH
jgi:hypothetical protein